jgi:hypothetical protein
MKMTSKKHGLQSISAHLGLFLVLVLFVAGASDPGGGSKENTLTRAERKAGWKLLFDGRTFTGWRGLGRDNVPAGLWVVEEGMIRKIKNSDVSQLPDGRPVEEGDLMTVETFEDFELYFEWKLEKGGNSGLKYNVSEQISQKYGSKYSALGFEYQMLDDGDPMYKNLKPAQFSGSLYDLIPATNIRLKPVGEFNSSRIIVSGKHAEHWLNGIKVVEYEFGSQVLEEAYKSSKFNKIPGFHEKRKAHIILQNHSDAAWFRNIKIREIKKDPGN